MMLLLCVAPGGQTAVGAENEFLTVPTETFRAQAAQADTDAGGSAGREPLAPQIVHRLPAPTRSEMSRADDAGAADDVDGLKPPVQHLGFGRNLAQHMGAVADSAGLSWVPTPDGGLAAALGVVSPGAKALRVRLAIEGAPRGLEVRVYDAAGTAATVAPGPRPQRPGAAGGA
ncbi:MAG: hypothetical protein F4X36_07950, partial [Gammaproteobacteria bacterium]|nr:hypothetical protein [Gammaproteobacteria bacterium]